MVRQLLTYSLLGSKHGPRNKCPFSWDRLPACRPNDLTGWKPIPRADTDGGYGANSFAIKNSFALAYFSDLETPLISRWHSCPQPSAFSFIFTPYTGW